MQQRPGTAQGPQRQQQRLAAMIDQRGYGQPNPQRPSHGSINHNLTERPETTETRERKSMQPPMFMGNRMTHPHMNYPTSRITSGIPKQGTQHNLTSRDDTKPKSPAHNRGMPQERVNPTRTTPGQTPKHQTGQHQQAMRQHHQPQHHQSHHQQHQQGFPSPQNGSRLASPPVNQPGNIQFQYQTPEVKRPRVNSDHEVRQGTTEKQLQQYQSVFFQPTTPGGRLNRSSSAASHLPGASSVVVDKSNPMIPGVRVNLQANDMTNSRQMVAMTPKTNATEAVEPPRPSLMDFTTQGREMMLKDGWDKATLLQHFREPIAQFILGFKIKQRMAPFDMTQVYRKEVQLPKKASKQRMKTLIFDMDETLIHTNEDVTIKSDYYVTINYPNGQARMAGVNVRPYAREILKELGKHFEIIVFTAGHSYYAIPVLNAFDPLNELIDHRVYRDNCVVSAEGDHIKDLRIFKGRRMEDTIIIDNSTISFLVQPENGIPILPFFNDKKDEELKKLVPYLMSMIGVQDVRQKLRETVKMHVYDQANSVEEAIHHISN